jgi:hypothetical protein
MIRKFNRGDIIGWKSDTNFTKDNKDIQSERVSNHRKCIDGEGWEYQITNYVGWQLQHELEFR